MSVDNLAVIIRSAHERTEALCEHLVKGQVPEDRVVVIHERPFSQALRRAFEIGLDFGLAWTLCIDADVLPRPGAIAELVAAVEAHPGETLGGSGLVFDKLRWSRRRGGLHLYRTTLLPSLIRHIPESDASLRPETDAKRPILEQGYRWALARDILGLHDFEQYYADIFRKMVVRAQKSADIAAEALQLALARSTVDKDFLAAAWGLRVGMSLQEPLELDAQQWTTETQVLLLANDLQEKGPLPIEGGSDLVEDRLDEYTGLYPESNSISGADLGEGSLRRRLYARLWQLGWITTRAGLRVQRASLRHMNKHSKPE
jgi:hypothetical protein